MDWDLIDWDMMGLVVIAVLVIYELNGISRHLGRIDQAIRDRQGQE